MSLRPANCGFQANENAKRLHLKVLEMVPKSLTVIPSQDADSLRERVGEEVEKVKGRFQDFFKR